MEVIGFFTLIVVAAGVIVATISIPTALFNKIKELRSTLDHHERLINWLQKRLDGPESIENRLAVLEEHVEEFEDEVVAAAREEVVIEALNSHDAEEAKRVLDVLKEHGLL